MVEKRGEEKAVDGFGRSKRRQAPPICACGPEDIRRHARLLENLLRPVVRDEVERRVQALSHPSRRPALGAGRSGVRSLKLQFVKKLPATLFTANSIIAEDGTSVQVELADTVTGARVTSGPNSSIKLALVVLKGDFCSKVEEDWTEQEFNAYISQQREGRRPLVTGDRTVTLREGVGTVGDIRFTDNSSWMWNRKFSLGAKPAQKHLGEIIREARSEPFTVKDHRGEAYQKHDRPSLRDEIWRLKHISKNGPPYQRLLAAGIRTVKDFLRRHAIDPSEVRGCLARVSDKKFDTIIKHAKTCRVDDRELYTYCGAESGVGLRFNSMYQVVAATFDSINYRSLETLNPSERAAVEATRQEAYEHEEDWVQVSEQSTVSLSRPSTSAPYQPFSVPEQGLQPTVIPMTNQDQLEPWFGFDPSSFSASLIVAPETSNQFEAPSAQNSFIVQNSLLTQEFGPGLYNGDLPVFQDMAVYDSPQVQMPSPFPGTWEAGNGFLIASLGVRAGKPKAAWCKIRAAVKWKIVRRVAARKMAKPLFNYCTTHRSAV